MEEDIFEQLKKQREIKEEELKKFLAGIKWESRHPKGGQMVGIDYGIILTHEDYGIRIEVSEKRSQTENRRIALHMFYFFLDQLHYLNKTKDGEDNTTETSQDVPGGS